MAVINKNRTNFEANAPQFSKRYAVSLDVIISLDMIAVTMPMMMVVAMRDSHILLLAI